VSLAYQVRAEINFSNWKFKSLGHENVTPRGGSPHTHKKHARKRIRSQRKVKNNAISDHWLSYNYVDVQTWRDGIRDFKRNDIGSAGPLIKPKSLIR